MASEEIPQTAASGDAIGIVEDTRTVVTAVFSDQHLAEGPTILVAAPLPFHVRVWRHMTQKDVPMEAVTNPNEDFHSDVEFASCLQWLRRTYGHADLLRVVLNGDTFEFMRSRWLGKYRTPNHEYASVVKMQTIAAGHPAYFDGLAEFIAAPNTEIVIIDGNHDQDLEWDEVRQVLRYRIGGLHEGRRSRIRFIGEAESFHFVEHGVWYEHMMQAEPANAVPRHCIRRPPGRQPYMVYNGNYAVMGDLVAEMKSFHPQLGRERDEPETWMRIIFHKWDVVRMIIVAYLMKAARVLLPFWRTGWLRDSALFITSTLVSAFQRAETGDKLVERHVDRIFEENPGVRGVIGGHIHELIRKTTEKGTYVNTGTWTQQVRSEEPRIPRTWKRFRWLELPVKAMGLFLATGEIHFARRLVRTLGQLALAIAMVGFLIAHFPRGEWTLFWGIGLEDLKTPIGILLGYLLLRGLVGFFAVQKEVVEFTRRPFALVLRHPDDRVQIELVEWDHEQQTAKEVY